MKFHKEPYPQLSAFFQALAYFMCSSLFCVSCSYFKSDAKKESETYSEKRTQMETEAALRLAVARRQLANDQCDSARLTIEQMRKDCYLALKAREDAIVLMDSVDLRQARAELSRIDSVLRANSDTIGKSDFEEACRKVEFYERKLQHDKQKH